MTRQHFHQLAQIAKGLCVYCGRRPLISKRCCQHCLTKRRSAQRAKLGFKPQYRTGRGRPRITIQPSPDSLSEQVAA